MQELSPNATVGMDHASAVVLPYVLESTDVEVVKKWANHTLKDRLVEPPYLVALSGPPSEDAAEKLQQMHQWANEKRIAFDVVQQTENITTLISRAIHLKEDYTKRRVSSEP